MSAMRKSVKNRRRKVIDCALFACSNQKYQYSIVEIAIYGITHCRLAYGYIPFYDFQAEKSDYSFF